MKKTILTLMVATMCLIGLVAAGQSGLDTTTVDAKVKDKITITAPDGVNLGDIYPVATVSTGAMSITVDSNKDYQVTATGSNVGVMTDNTNNLGHAMEIQNKDAAWTALSASVNIKVGSKPGATFSAFARQLVDFNDVPSETYQITLTFTAIQP